MTAGGGIGYNDSQRKIKGVRMKKILILGFLAWFLPATHAEALNARISVLLEDPGYDRECLARLLPAICPTNSRDPATTTQWWLAGGYQAWADDVCIERADVSPCLVRQ